MILNFFFNAGNTPILEGMNLNIVEEKKPNGKFNDGKSFITIDGIRQRIRLHDKIKNLNITTPITAYNDRGSFCEKYTFNKNMRWINNNLNMNPMFLLSGKDPKNDYLVAYITVTPEFKILSYNTSFSILQTYYSKDKYQGCVVVAPMSDVDEHEGWDLLTINGYNNATGKYESVTFEYSEKKCAIDVSNIPITEVTEKYAEKDKRYKGSLPFKIMPAKKNTLITSTYVTDEKNYDKVASEYTKNIKNAVIIKVEQDEINNNPSSVVEKIKTEIGDKRVRAITQVGVRIPREIYMELHQIFVFDYDEKKGLKCIKSN